MVQLNKIVIFMSNGVNRLALSGNDMNTQNKYTFNTILHRHLSHGSTDSEKATYISQILYTCIFARVDIVLN